MDIDRVRQLAGTTRVAEKGELTFYRELVEVVEIPGDISMEELSKRMDACKRALSIATTMQDPADKKKWVSACFVNLNKVRAALARMIKNMDVQAPAAPAAPAAAPTQPANGDGKFMIGSARI
jgi:hypothetical protein